MREQELIRRCLNRDKKAWDYFVQRYNRLIYWAIHRRLAASGFVAGEEDVNTIFQEVFVTLIEGNKLSRVKEAKALAGWLVIVASSRAADFMRSSIRAGRRVLSDAAACQETAPQQEVMENDSLRTVQKAIEALPARERLVISLNLIEGRTHHEISQALAMPANTVSTIIARTKLKLRTELKKLGINGMSR